MKKCHNRSRILFVYAFIVRGKLQSCIKVTIISDKKHFIGNRLDKRVSYIYILIWLIHVWCFQNHFLIVSWAVLNINILQVNRYMFLCYGIIGLSNYDLSIQIDWEESWWVLNPHVSCIWCFIILLPTHEPTFTSMFFPLLL